MGFLRWCKDKYISFTVISGYGASLLTQWVNYVMMFTNVVIFLTVRNLPDWIAYVLAILYFPLLVILGLLNRNHMVSAQIARKSKMEYDSYSREMMDMVKGLKSDMQIVKRKLEVD